MSETLVIARNPQEMATAQQSLLEWAERKITEAKTVCTEMEESLALAVKNKWNTKGLKGAVKRALQQLSFYEKTKEALAAGYIIVPNFPIDVFAIRTEKERPVRHDKNYRWGTHDQQSEAPRFGRGKYLAARPKVQHDTWTEPGKEPGKQITVHNFFACEFQDVIMPLIAVQPTLMKDLERAMLPKIFDEIGIAPQVARRDPMLIGQVIYPPTGHRISFLLAWWLSAGDLEI